MGATPDDGRSVHHPVRIQSCDDVVVRTLRSEDKAELRRFFDELSTDSRYQRFMSGKAAISDSALRTLVDDVDHIAHEALVAACADGRIAGEGRWIRDPDEPTTAEFAITVADEWQRCGVGTALAEDLAGRAAAQGVEQFTAQVLVENEGIHRLLEQVGEVESQHLDGQISELRVSTAGHEGPAANYPILRRLLRSAASGEFVVVPWPLRLWAQISMEVTRTLLVPVKLMIGRR